MFDKLIASDATGADFKPRRSYFLVSSVVVGIMFFSAVVYSIFASDFGLGTNSFELAELLPIVDMAATENEPPKPQTTIQSRSTNQVATRQIIMSRTDESTFVPTSVSATANTHAARPQFGDYKISRVDSEGTPGNGSGRDGTGSGPSGTGLSDITPIADNVRETAPPPVIKAPPVKKDMVRSIGVANGKATYLPKPPYPTAAIAVNAQGAVDVQVMIDETGRVVSARAVSGNPLLRLAAEQAARNARFSPTLLSNVPIKVTGVIVYNFMRS